MEFWSKELLSPNMNITTCVFIRQSPGFIDYPPCFVLGWVAVTYNRRLGQHGYLTVYDVLIFDINSTMPGHVVG
jgi:hypothetical protein